MIIQSTKSFDSFEILVKLMGGLVEDMVGLTIYMISRAKVMVGLTF